MTFSVLVQQLGDDYAASLIGSPELRCVRPSRDEAIEALRNELTERMANQEIVNIEVPVGVSSLTGLFRDDPELREICDQIYRDRDAQRLP